MVRECSYKVRPPFLPVFGYSSICVQRYKKYLNCANIDGSKSQKSAKNAVWSSEKEVFICQDGYM